jgi:hypothetical protein
MLSCGQPLWASFTGVRTQSYKPDGDPNWVPCKLGVTPDGEPNKSADYCVTGEYCGDILHPEPCTLENQVYQSTRYAGNPNQTCSTNTNFQSCANFASKKQILDFSTQRGDDFGFGASTCYSLICGGCRDGKMLDVPCVTGGSSGLIHDGTVKDLNIDLILDDGTPADWEMLQTSYCLPGTPLKIAGIVIKRYTGGTPICDTIMRKSCASTAQLTLDPELLTACQCILEEKRLQSQFAGVNLPVQCFTTVCDIANPDVYRTAEQVEGCSARLCTQTLTVHGENILSQGFQEIICNGQVYNLTDLPPAVSVGFIEKDPASTAGINLGPVFYIALGLLLMMLILVFVWGVQSRRRSRRLTSEKTTEAESMLLSKIN